jgi:hypothetical protein
MRRFYTEGDCPGFIEMHAEWSGEGDNNTTTITFSQNNGMPAQTIRVTGSIEWNAFVRAIRNLDLARKGEPPLPSQFDDEDELGDGAAQGVIAAR